MTALYVVESGFFEVEHGAQRSRGVAGSGGGGEKLYLHVLSLSEGEIAKLGPRVDEEGNKQHARLALPGNEEWWVALEGEVAWPGTHRPRVVSSCDLSGAAPRPRPLSADDRAALARVGVTLPT